MLRVAPNPRWNRRTLGLNEKLLTLMPILPQRIKSRSNGAAAIRVKVFETNVDGRFSG